MKKLLVLLVVIFMSFTLVGCVFEDSPSDVDIQAQFDIGDKLAEAQPTPADIEYSLERYNLIKRAYWVNGQRAKAASLPSPVTDMPLGYIVLFSGPTVVAQFTVYGKVSSLNSWLTPDFIDEYISNGGIATVEMPDVDGTYGTNDDGIFFFTPTGQYIEWTGEYLYTDYYITVDNPVVTIIPNE